MSIRIALADPPEFYTNLDIISGKVILGISRPEDIGAITVKLEGESKTALCTPDSVQDSQLGGYRRRATTTESSQTLQENHKILYRVLQVFPAANGPAYSSPVLNPGQHEFPFRFKVPFNNACGDPNAMAKIGGLAGAGGLAGSGLFGMGGVRLMDGTKQLLYTHVTKTLPPSFTGFPKEAEIRYYIKVTVQRPSLFKENWRHQIGFKFMPIEPPRPPQSNQEAYARRPFTFRPKSPASARLSQLPPKRQSVFSRKPSSQGFDASSIDNEQPPSIEVSARLPHPSILTCNKAVPLRILAKKLVDTRAECYLVSLQIDLVGSTVVRCQDLVNTETTRWVVTSRHGLAIPLQRGPDDAVGTETEVNDVLWTSKPLPNTVMPSFVTCNLKRSYDLELKLGVSWGKPPGATDPIPEEPAPAGSKASKMKVGKNLKGKGKEPVYNLAQTIFLPLHFSSVQVYSGLAPPESLAKAAIKSRTRTQQQQQQQQRQRQQRQQQQQRPSARPGAQPVPTLPPRQNQAQPQQDPLYPPQLRPGQVAGQAQTAVSPGSSGMGGAAAAEFEGAAPPYDEAPPSYNEAMAEAVTEPVVPAGQARPAWSGVTNENEPDSLPAEKG